jgi:uncharacterized membrane protein
MSLVYRRQSLSDLSLRGLPTGLVVSLTFFLSSGFAHGQQASGSSTPPKGQSRPNASSSQQGKSQDTKRMELEERRRLRQEIQRHGPAYRTKDVVAAPLSAPAPLPLPSAAPVVQPPVVPPTTALPPLPNYFGYPTLPAPAVNASSSAVPSMPSGISRGPTLSQEERQQLRQQIRDERRRGLYPTPSEVDR